MNKKLIVSLIIILLIAISAGYITYTKNYTNIGSSTISIPDGYDVKNITSNSTILKNKKTKLTVVESNQTTDRIINEYKNKHINETITEDSLNLNNYTLKSLSLKNDKNKTERTLYFYEKNNKTYEIILTGKYDQKAIQTIVKSTSDGIFGLV